MLQLTLNFVHVSLVGVDEVVFMLAQYLNELLIVSIEHSVHLTEGPLHLVDVSLDGVECRVHSHASLVERAGQLNEEVVENCKNDKS